MLSPAEATTYILAHVTPLASERCTLRDAPGRVLRQDVLSERDNPPFDRVCMDGVAIDSRAPRRGERERIRVQR